MERRETDNYATYETNGGDHLVLPLDGRDGETAARKILRDVAHDLEVDFEYHGYDEKAGSIYFVGPGGAALAVSVVRAAEERLAGKAECRTCKHWRCDQDGTPEGECLRITNGPVYDEPYINPDDEEGGRLRTPATFGCHLHTRRSA